MIHNNLSNVSWRDATAYGNAAAWGRARNQQNAPLAQNVATQTMKTAVREEEESPLVKKMKEMQQTMGRLQGMVITPAQARKRAAQQKIVQLRDRVRLLQGSLASSSINKGHAKSAARELKELARQLAAAVRELKGGGGGAGGGGGNLGAMAAAGMGEVAAVPGEGGEAGEVNAGDEGAQQAAAQAEQAAREAEQQAQEGAQSAERASDEAQAAAQAANGQAQAVDENRPAAPTQGKGEDSPDGGMGEMIKEIKQGLRNAASLLRARLHESQRREKRDLDEMEAILRKMETDELNEAIRAMYGGDGASVGVQSAQGALLHEQA